ncbi:MAG: DegV family protein [Chloroflexi bacterium]|nr:DegV family protein [Chloroflexota bacterium]MBU1746564.1 DegV family protein [Chloroflexota bacterium]MBU1878610.1 DegV family protein [Chloroflexota bacterium]
MRRKVSVVTDSTADIPLERAEELGLTVVPLNIHFGSQVFQDQVDLSTNEFFQRLSESQVLPTTSAPSAGLFQSVYERLTAQSRDILSIHVSSGLSTTLESAMHARDALLGRCNVYVIDSLTTSASLGMLATAAARAAMRGQDLAEIAKMVRGMVPQVHIQFFVDTLEYLEHVGFQFPITPKAANTKPILKVEQGTLSLVERVRSRARALDKLYEFVADFPRVEKLVVVQHAPAPEIQRLLSRVVTIVPPSKITEAPYGPALGTCLGTDAIGVAVYEGEEEW